MTSLDLPFRALIDRLGAAVWEAEPASGSFTAISAGVEALLGYPTERWTSEPGLWLEHIHPADRARIAAEVDAAVAAGEPADLEYRCLHADGDLRWVRNHVQPTDTGFCGVVVDLTERRAAEEANAVLDAIITAAPEGFALFDTDLRYVRVNAWLAELNNLPVADHPGRTIAEILPDVAPETVEAPLRRVLATGAPVVDEEVVRHVPGRERPITVLVSYYPVPGADGEIAFLGALVTDITVRKRAELRTAQLAELGTLLDEVVSVEQRMQRLVEVLVPAVFDTCTVSFRLRDGTLAPVAARGDGTPSHEVPLIVRGRDLGVLAASSDRRGPDEAAFVEEVARRAALAVDNARLFEAEQAARDRSATQYALAAALAEALTPADVAAAALSELVPAVGAEHGAVWMIGEDERSLEAIAWLGFTDEEIASQGRIPLTAERPLAEALRRRRTVWVPDPAGLAARFPELAPSFEARELRSVAALPLTTAGRPVGGLFLSASHPHALGEEDLELAVALAAQTAQALERARFYAAERHVSVTLQRSLLPAELPEVDGVEFDLRYLPAAGLEAGGDFYEALELPDGTVLFACGDVVGRGATAAAAMGQLRSALRAFALVGGGPAEILTRLSTFADTVEAAMAATAVVGKLDVARGELRYAAAGHPWPLLIRADASAEYLTEGRGVPLGCLAEPGYAEATVTLAPGTTLLLYTDGLSERRDEDVAVVLERLRSVTAACAVETLGDQLDAAVAVAGDAIRADDIALVGVRVTQPGRATLRRTYAGELDQVPVARGEVRAWLAEQGVGGPVGADLLLACGEAVANAIEHAASETVDVELTVPADGVVAITVRDHGAWRPPPDATDRGRGFGLMRALTDECTIDRGPTGTVVRLRRRVTPAPGPLPLPPSASCAVAFDGDRALVTGDLDLAAAAAVAAELRAARVIDLTGVTYLDSTGARMLLGIAGAAIVAPRGTVARRALDLNGLGTVLDLRDA